MKTCVYVVATHEKRLVEALLIRTHTICLSEEKVFFCYPSYLESWLRYCSYEPGHSTYHKTMRAPSETSDQPAHARSLISLRRSFCE